MAKLFFRYGAMSASKSANLLMIAHNYEERGMTPLIFNFAKDTRFGEGIVASRIGIDKPSQPFDDDTDFLSLISRRHDQSSIACVLVDEAQFLSKCQVEQLCDVVDRLSIPVICYGLRTDFRGDLFEGAMWLMAWADTIEEIKTVCWCNSKATFNARLDSETGAMLVDGEQEQIGHQEYVSLCRRHWKKKRDETT